MAKMNGDFSFTGRLGNLSAYRMKGVEQVVLRTIGGPKKGKIKRNPSCAGILRNATEFGGPAKAAKSIRNALFPVLHLTNRHLQSSFTELAKEVQKMDTVSQKGERNVWLSQHGEVLEGFDFHTKTPFSSIIPQTPVASISRDTISASVQLPALLPGINFFVPGTFGLFRCVVVLGVMHDLLYRPQGYQPAPYQGLLYPVSVYTDWLPTSMPFAGQQMELSIADNPVLGESDTLVLAAGVEFGTPVTSTFIKPLPHAGAAKILAVARATAAS